MIELLIASMIGIGWVFYDTRIQLDMDYVSQYLYDGEGIERIDCNISSNDYKVKRFLRE